MPTITLPSLEPPLDSLARLGRPDAGEKRPDYRELGLSEAHIPTLIDLARRWVDLAWAESDDELPEGDALWAPIHAWRALAQLQAVTAVEPLLEVLNALEDSDDDWGLGEFSEVLSRIGPGALEPLGAFLADPERGLYARSTVGEAISRLGRNHPELRDEAVRRLTDQLGHYEEQDPALNGFLICHLLRINAAEAAETIERAYAAGCVDRFIPGRWTNIREKLGVPGLGLVQEPELPLPPLLPGLEFAPDSDDPAYDPFYEPSPDRPSISSEQRTQKKAKRKQQAQARKQNRKKKKKR